MYGRSDFSSSDTPVITSAMRSLVIGAPSVFFRRSTRPVTERARWTIDRNLPLPPEPVNAVRTPVAGRRRRRPPSEASADPARRFGERVGGGHHVVARGLVAEADADAREGAALGGAHRGDRGRGGRIARAAGRARPDGEAAAVHLVAPRPPGADPRGD